MRLWNISRLGFTLPSPKLIWFESEGNWLSFFNCHSSIRPAKAIPSKEGSRVDWMEESWGINVLDEQVNDVKDMLLLTCLFYTEGNMKTKTSSVLFHQTKNYSSLVSAARTFGANRLRHSWVVRKTRKKTNFDDALLPGRRIVDLMIFTWLVFFKFVHVPFLPVKRHEVRVYHSSKSGRRKMYLKRRRKKLKLKM